MKTWLFYPLINAPMPFQMAFDELVFLRVLEARRGAPLAPVGRFYFSSEPWETIGYSQKTEESLSGLPVCRRLTGGGKVRHGEDLIFSLVANKSDHPSFQHVGSSYVAVHEAIKLAIDRTAGKSVRFYRCSENLPKGNDCFRFPIVSDLAAGKAKVAGGAQKRSCGILLHQESIRYAPAGAGVFMDALRKAFEELWGIRWHGCDLEPGMIPEAESLSKLKYENGGCFFSASKAVGKKAPLDHSAQLAGALS